MFFIILTAVLYVFIYFYSSFYVFCLSNLGISYLIFLIDFGSQDQGGKSDAFQVFWLSLWKEKKDMFDS